MDVKKLQSILQKYIDAGRGDFPVAINVGCDCNMFAPDVFELRVGDVRVRPRQKFVPSTPPGTTVVGDVIEFGR